MNIDAVAEAILYADEQYVLADLDEGERDRYRRMAVVAIEALGLTEEWALQNGIIKVCPMSKKDALAKAARWPESFDAVSRFVSPWVRTDQ